LNSPIKSAATALLVAACLLLWVDSAFAQDDTTHVVYYTGRSIRPHPDGAVGSVGFHGFFQYALVTKPANVPVVDVEKYQGAFNWVIADQANLMARFLTIKEDSVRYELGAGLRLYSGNPVATSRGANPDGPVGLPVLSLWGGMRYNELSIKEPKTVGDAEVTFPVSRRLSISAGYRYFEEIEEADVQQGYGTVSIYVARYVADSAYTNPDGPVNNVAIHLSGGGSPEGVFGDLTLMFPISNNLTWRLSVRGERVTEPYRRSAILGVGFSVYPSN